MKTLLKDLKVSQLKPGDVIGMFIVGESRFPDTHMGLKNNNAEWYMENPDVQRLIDAFGVEREVELQTVASGVFSWDNMGNPRIVETHLGEWLRGNVKPGDLIEVKRAGEAR